MSLYNLLIRCQSLPILEQITSVVNLSQLMPKSVHDMVGHWKANHSHKEVKRIWLERLHAVAWLYGSSNRRVLDNIQDSF